MDDVDGFRDRLLSGDRDAAQAFADALIEAWRPHFKAIEEAAAIIAKSGLAAQIVEALHAD